MCFAFEKSKDWEKKVQACGTEIGKYELVLLVSELDIWYNVTLDEMGRKDWNEVRRWDANCTVVRVSSIEVTLNYIIIIIIAIIIIVIIILLLLLL